jgi:peptidoglycan/LPS O-acetylase OafA/YrhL
VAPPDRVWQAARGMEPVAVTTKRRVEVLDGIRAMAITLVIAHHAGFAQGGGIGVTVFFVLSGFLITGLLMRPKALSPGGMGRFYLRRSLRLFPALLVVCVVALAWALATQTGHARHFLLTEVLTSITYTQDFYLGHGHATDDFGYLGHTWSLAIEQQFYLLWPLILLGIVKLVADWRGRVALTLLLALVSTAWRAHLAGQGLNSHVGLNIDAQADTLLVGCALALAMPSIADALPARQRWLDAGALLMLVGLLAFSMTHLNRAIPGRIGYLLVALGTAALITRLLTPATTAVSRRLHQLFSLRPVVWIGLISYSLYLWHPFLFAVAKRDLNITSRPAQLLSAPLLLAVILLVSWLSYRWVEQPFQRLKDRRIGDTATARGPLPAVLEIDESADRVAPGEAAAVAPA